MVTALTEAVKKLIAGRYPQAMSSGFAVVEQERHLGIGTMTALLEERVGSCPPAPSS
jgi:hypothetical protein